MSWEFWTIWETPIEVTFYDMENQYTDNSAVTLNGAVLGEDDYTIKTTKSGEKKVEISPEVIKKHEGEKIEVKLEPNLETNLENFKDYVDLETGELTIIGKVSDTNSNVFIILNDEEFQVEYDENGEFNKKLQLIEGRNTIKAYAKNAEREFGKVDGSITYTAPEIIINEFDFQKFFDNYKTTIIISLIVAFFIITFASITFLSILMKKNLFLEGINFIKNKIQ